MYLPTADVENTQICTLQNLENALLPYAGEDIFIVRDYNVCMDNLKDHFNHRSSNIRNPHFREEVKTFLNVFSLCDVWQIYHPNKRMFTWFRSNTASRLDYIFALEHCSGSVQEADVMYVSFSDHRIVYIRMGKKLNKHGPGFWKLDISLLNNAEVREAVSSLVTKKRDEYADMNASLKWDLLKFDLQNLFRFWKTKLFKENQNLSDDQQAHISEISSQEELSEEDFETLQALRRELFTLQKSNEDKAILRSKARWAMYAGKPSKFFLNLEKNSYSDKVITQ